MPGQIKICHCSAIKLSIVREGQIKQKNLQLLKSLTPYLLFRLQKQEMHLHQGRHINEKYALVDSELLGKGYVVNSPQLRVAIKAIDLKQIDNEVTRYLLSCQIAALSNLGKVENTGHQNVIRLLDVVIQGNYIYLVTELLEGGTLAEYIKKNQNGLPQQQAFFIFRQLLEAYRHIRCKGVVHRDLKPDNVLFRVKPEISKQIAIIDFGYCEKNEVPNKPQMYYNVGSPKYMAPEAYVDNLYSQKSDIWALGVIFYEMLVGKTCDQGMKMEAYLQMIRRNGIPLPNNINPFYKHILAKMLHYNHQHRAEITHLLQEIEIYQSNLELHRSQVQMQATYNQTGGFSNFGQRGNRNNPVFKSTLVPGQPPPQLFQSQMQNNVIIHQVSAKTFADQQKQAEKKFIKSNSTRNVVNSNNIIFNVTTGPQILKRVENNVENRSNFQNMRLQVKNPPFQQLNLTQAQQLQQSQAQAPHQPIETHVQSQKIQFHVIPSQPPIQIPQNRQHRFITTPQMDQNAIKILIKSANFQRRVNPHPTAMSIEKSADNIHFHSPQRRSTPQNIQFFTQKKLRPTMGQGIRQIIDRRIPIVDSRHGLLNQTHSLSSMFQ